MSASGQLTGTIPEDIGKLSLLGLLDLSDNLLTGTLPDTVGNLSNLELFAVANNQIMGTLGDSIGNWQKLGHLSLFTNRFSGSLPSTISSWSNLIFFAVDVSWLIECIVATFHNPCWILTLWLIFGRTISSRERYHQ